MKILLILIIGLFYQVVVAQEVTTTYHLNDSKESLTKDAKKAYFYRNISFDTVINNIKIYKLEEYFTSSNSLKKIALVTYSTPTFFRYFYEKQEFYPEGGLKSFEKFNITGTPIDTAFYCYPNNKLKMITFRNPKRDNIVSNKSLEYIAYYNEKEELLLSNGNGTIRFPIFQYLGEHNYEEGEMANSRKHGQWKGIVGKYTFEETYENGQLISGNSINTKGDRVAYTKETAYQEPSYPGGIESLRRYIAENYKYPTQALKNRVYGRVLVEFFVGEEGLVSDIKILEDLGYETGQAAIDLVSRIRGFKPGTIKGIPQKTKYTLPINLDLNGS